jgi:hypothetical protein
MSFSVKMICVSRGLEQHQARTYGIDYFNICGAGRKVSLKACCPHDFSRTRVPDVVWACVKDLCVCFICAKSEEDFPRSPAARIELLARRRGRHMYSATSRYVLLFNSI